MLIGTGHKRFERKKFEILAAARAIFLREGYPDTGMEGVARAAGVSTATLYAYFPSKAELFRVVLLEAAGGLDGAVDHGVRVEGDARSRLLALTVAYAALLTRPETRAIFRLVTAERRRFGDVAEHVLRRARDKLGAAAITVLDDLRDSGELEIEKTSWAAGQLLGMLDHATLLLGLIAGDDAQPARPLDHICADAVDTFLARYGRPPAAVAALTA